MLRASKTYKGWSPQGSWCSPLEGVAEALRGALLLREWPRLFPHRMSVVHVYVYWNTETPTADLAGPRSEVRVTPLTGGFKKGKKKTQYNGMKA